MRGPGAPGASLGEETMIQSRLLEMGMSGRYLPEAGVWHWVPAERCSLQWTLERSYRQGVSAGLASRARGPAIFGCPGGLWPARALGWARSAVAAISFYPRWRFNARCWRSRNRGMMRGWREGMRVQGSGKENLYPEP
jgi:hypothetical protein